MSPGTATRFLPSFPGGRGAGGCAAGRRRHLDQLPGRARRRRLTVLNTRAEHDRFVETLPAFEAPVVAGFEAPVVAGFEATGNCRRPLARRLRPAGIEPRLISSLALARTREAITNGWDRNDPKDAPIVLHMRRIGHVQRYCDPLAHGPVDIRELSGTHEAISKATTELWHRLMTHDLPLHFPEAERFRGNARSDWFLAFLEMVPLPAMIAALETEAFIAAAWDAVGRKVSRHRLLPDICETAQTAIGLPVDPSSDAVVMFRMVLAEGRSLIRQRAEIEQRAAAMLADDRDYRLLRTIPGVGPVNALTILAEAGDHRRLAHHRQFPKYCGLDLSTRQSGQFRGQTKLSKFGSARLRRALWMAGQIAIRQRDNSFRSRFERHVARDRDNPDLRRKALSAIAARMARTAHALVKRGVDCRPFLEGAVPGGRTPL